MRCPFCFSPETQVKDSRPADDGRAIRRRRYCPSCHKRFTTFERFEIQQLYVVKSDGNRELFEADKLTRSLLTALRKRPVNRQQVQDLVHHIVKRIHEIGKTELSSKEIGAFALEALKEVDFIGYIRYASVYNAFSSAEDFQKLMGDV